LRDFRKAQPQEQENLQKAWDEATRSDDIASAWAQEYTEEEARVREEEETWFSQFLPGGPKTTAAAATSTSTTTSWESQYNSMNQGVNEWAKQV
jgi:hypothetical protein